MQRMELENTSTSQIFDKTSIIVLFMLSITTMPSIIHFSATGDFSDERFFAYYHSSIFGENIQTARKMNVFLNNPDQSFRPSMNILSRIMRVILEKNSVLRTNLSQEANIQYTRLLKHLEWLDTKHMIESVIVEGKINIKLTEQGKEFAMLICEL